MRILVWNDYICPWAYLGRHRTGVLASMGHTVTSMPFELHPEITTPRPIRPGGRLEALFEHIAGECAESGLEFSAPSRAVNSRRALETAEVVRQLHPGSFASFDGALAHAYFVEDLDISSIDVIAGLLDRCGIEPRPPLAALAAGDGVLPVVNSMNSARDAGVTATPAWLLPNGFVIPGVQPVGQMTRWVSKIASREDHARTGQG